MEIVIANLIFKLALKLYFNSANFLALVQVYFSFLVQGLQSSYLPA